MIASQGNWVRRPDGQWVDQNTGFISAIDPNFAPPNIDLPQAGDQNSYNQFEGARNDFRKQAGTYMTMNDAQAGRPIMGANVDTQFSPQNPYDPSAQPNTYTPPAAAQQPQSPMIQAMTQQQPDQQFNMPQLGMTSPGLAGNPEPSGTGGISTNYGTSANNGFSPVTGGNLTDNGEFNPSTLNAAMTPAPPQVPNQFPQDFNSNYFGTMNNLAGQAQSQFDFRTPQAQAALMDTSQVPQPNAQQFGTSPELQQLLSGQGYDPATIARLNAGAIDNNSNSVLGQMSQSKRALGQAGLQNSPAGAAIQADIARQGYGNQNTALNDIALQNAQQGMQNRLAGVGFQSQIGLSNMEAANQMALANANRLFSAFSQNQANTQQSSLFNAGNENARETNRANATNSVLGGFGQNWGNAATNLFGNANAFNAGNIFQNNENNAQRMQGTGLANLNTQENRHQNALNVFNQGFAPIA